VLRSVQDRSHRSGLADHAFLEHQHVIGDGGHDAEVVGNEKQG
jgi:hypothetical protein